jgi:hypothetical protein
MFRASRLARWAALLVISSCLLINRTKAKTNAQLEERINGLEAEVQALRQQLHGAAVLKQDLAAAGKERYHAAFWNTTCLF